MAVIDFFGQAFFLRKVGLQLYAAIDIFGQAFFLRNGGGSLRLRFKQTSLVKIAFQERLRLTKLQN
ncbi:hypothetical protein A9239_17320 [Methanosarcina sp. A14]|nr:hypothetical protein A9239_17320 [Methanosarcina sp. A14]